MEHSPRTSSSAVSNLVPIWDDTDGGGSFEPAEAATVVEQVLRVEPLPAPRLVSPPEQFDPAEPVERRSAYSYDLLRDDDDTWAEARGGGLDEAVRTSEPEAGAEHAPRDRRSAYEIAFIMLAAAVSVLLAAPPLVQVLLAARGIQA